MYDVIIVGAGMVGASLACALGENGLRVAVLEKGQLEPQWQTAHDIRVSALTRASQRIFENLEVWKAIAPLACPYESMRVWDGSGSGKICFDCTELAEPNLGHIVENRVILRSVLQRMQALSNVDSFAAVSLKTVDIQESQAIVELENGPRLSARLLVAADGKSSWLRSQLNIAVRAKNYAQHALVTVVQTRGNHQNTAWQRFFPTGPLAFLPLHDGYSAIVWSNSITQARVLLEMPESAFRESLEQHFGDQLGTIEGIEQRAVFPLGTHQAERYLQHRCVLVGDAAHSVHPLAGQGVNMGLLDAACLAEVLDGQYKKHRDIGQLVNLRKYERWRRAENALMLHAMDGFQQLFSNRHPLLLPLRNHGMNIVNCLNPLKNGLMQQAMGLNGDLPLLAR